MYIVIEKKYEQEYRDLLLLTRANLAEESVPHPYETEKICIELKCKCNDWHDLHDLHLTSIVELPGEFDVELSSSAVNQLLPSNKIPVCFKQEIIPCKDPIHFISKWSEVSSGSEYTLYKGEAILSNGTDWNVLLRITIDRGETKILIYSSWYRSEVRTHYTVADPDDPRSMFKFLWEYHNSMLERTPMGSYEYIENIDTILNDIDDVNINPANKKDWDAATWNLAIF